MISNKIIKKEFTISFNGIFWAKISGIVGFFLLMLHYTGAQDHIPLWIPLILLSPIITFLSILVIIAFIVIATLLLIVAFLAMLFLALAIAFIVSKVKSFFIRNDINYK